MSTDSTTRLVYSSVIDSQHHGALAKIAAGLCLTASLEMLVMRLLVRWPWRSLFGYDDALLTLATVLSVIQVACTISAVDKGFGTLPDLLSNGSILTVERLVCAGNFLYVFSLYIGKVSVAFFFWRLTDFRSAWAKGFIAVSGAFGIAAVLALAIQTGSRSWLYEETTSNGMVARWTVVEVLSSLLDILTAIFPIYLVGSLQMRRAMKIQVIGLFWLRLPLIALATLHVLALSHEFRGSRGTTVRYVRSQIYLQVEMAYSLCTATLPCLRLFLKATESGILGLLPEVEVSNSRRAVAGSNSFSRSKSRVKLSNEEGDDAIELIRPRT